MRVLITGANGFVGRALVKCLLDQPDITPIAGLRHANSPGTSDLSCERLILGDLSARSVPISALKGLDAVVHTAARVHILHESEGDTLAAFRASNVAASLALAEAAAQAGVRRFVFVSSIKVNGEESPPDGPFTVNAPPDPADPYAISKWEAEQALRALCTDARMEWVVIRPPLVYGPGVKANFLTLMRWVRRGVPLPFANVCNRRRFVALANLVDLLRVCINHPGAANETFLVGDAEELSTPELVRRLAIALDVPERLFAMPEWMLKTCAAAVGRQAAVQRLCGNLRVDISRTRDVLEWSPPVCVDRALRDTARDYLERNKT